MNEKKVLLTVIGTQNFGREEDKVELTTMGVLSEEQDCYVVCYEEQEENPEEVVHVRLQIQKDAKQVQMERDAHAHSCLLIRLETRSQCQYATQFGQITMGIFGRQIEMQIEEEQGKFEFCYAVDMNGDYTSTNRVEIKYNTKKSHVEQ